MIDSTQSQIFLAKSQNLERFANSISTRREADNNPFIIGKYEGRRQDTGQRKITTASGGKILTNYLGSSLISSGQVVDATIRSNTIGGSGINLQK